MCSRQSLFKCLDLNSCLKWFFMFMASLYLLLLHIGSLSRIFVLSQQIICPVFSTYTAILLLLFPVFTALWCSFSLTSGVLPIFPMYVEAQLQLTWYTTPVTFSLTRVRMLRSVLLDWKIAFIFRSLHVFYVFTKTSDVWEAEKLWFALRSRLWIFCGVVLCQTFLDQVVRIAVICDNILEVFKFQLQLLMIAYIFSSVC